MDALAEECVSTQGETPTTLPTNQPNRFVSPPPLPSQILDTRLTSSFRRKMPTILKASQDCGSTMNKARELLQRAREGIVANPEDIQEQRRAIL